MILSLSDRVVINDSTDQRIMSSSAGALAVLGLRLYGGARLQQQFDHLRVATFCRAQEWRKTSGSSDELWTRTGLDSTGATALHGGPGRIRPRSPRRRPTSAAARPPQCGLFWPPGEAAPGLGFKAEDLEYQLSIRRIMTEHTWEAKRCAFVLF